MVANLTIIKTCFMTYTASYYEPAFAKDGHVDCSVPANSTLTIDTEPNHRPRWYLDEGQDVKIGFLKLFVSTQWVDHSNIEQPSFST